MRRTLGWVNAYEQSKYEAERLVMEQAASWVILRSSTVVCDDVAGHVTQMNAVHRALESLSPRIGGDDARRRGLHRRRSDDIVRCRRHRSARAARRRRREGGSPLRG